MTTSLRVTPVANQPTSSPAAARVVSPMSDRAPAPFRTTPILDGNSLIPRGPERDFDSAGVSADDVAAVKEAVLRYLAMLNAGDVETRAKVYLSESTGFGFDGGMLTAGMEDQAVAADPGQSYDLRCRDLRIYIHKDTAIATGYLVGAVTRMDGPSTRTAGRSTWVLLRQGAEWKLAHTHLSQLSPDALGPSAFQGFDAQRKRPYRAS
jgi:ketosteroid isomerase-like protein